MLFSFFRSHNIPITKRTINPLKSDVFQETTAVAHIVHRGGAYKPPWWFSCATTVVS